MRRATEASGWRGACGEEVGARGCGCCQASAHVPSDPRTCFMREVPGSAFSSKSLYPGPPQATGALPLVQWGLEVPGNLCPLRGSPPPVTDRYGGADTPDPSPLIGTLQGGTCAAPRAPHRTGPELPPRAFPGSHSPLGLFVVLLPLPTPFLIFPGDTCMRVHSGPNLALGSKETKTLTPKFQGRAVRQDAGSSLPSRA